MSANTRTFNAVDLPGLHRLAAALVEHLQPPQCIGLVGTLGAGKTTLVQAIAQAADVKNTDVTSPTFTLLQTHVGSIRIHHLDAYRLADDDEFLELGVEELFDDTQAWTIVEWADRVARVMPPTTLWIELLIAADSAQRTIQLRYPSDQRTEIDRIRIPDGSG